MGTSISTLQAVQAGLIVVLAVSAAIAIVISLARYFLFDRDSGADLVTRRIVNVCTITLFISLFGTISTYAADAFVSSNPIAREIEANAGTDNVPKAMNQRIDHGSNFGEFMNNLNEQKKNNTSNLINNLTAPGQPDNVAATGNPNNDITPGYYNASPEGITFDSLVDNAHKVEETHGAIANALAKSSVKRASSAANAAAREHGAQTSFLESILNEYQANCM